MIADIDLDPEEMTLSQYDRYRERKLLADCEAMAELQRDADAKEQQYLDELNRPADRQISKVENGKTMLLFGFNNLSGGRCFIWADNLMDAYRIVTDYTNGQRDPWPVILEKCSS